MELENLEVGRESKWVKGVRVSEMAVEGYNSVWVDAGLVEALEVCRALGYRSAQSCSGLKEDHKEKEVTRGGYIAWFAEDLSVGQKEAIEMAARAAGLECKESELFFLPGVVVRADKLMDGTSEGVVRQEATKRTNQAWGIEKRPEGEEFMDWLRERDDLLEAIKKTHGGTAISTDEAGRAAWKAFAEALLSE